MRSVAPTPKKAEAAQANRGGLECSSYTWQVRRCVYAFCMAESQEDSRSGTASERLINGNNFNINSMLDDLTRQPFRALGGAR
jgi:hypothetical protein